MWCMIYIFLHVYMHAHVFVFLRTHVFVWASMKVLKRVCLHGNICSFFTPCSFENRKERETYKDIEIVRCVEVCTFRSCKHMYLNPHAHTQPWLACIRTHTHTRMHIPSLSHPPTHSSAQHYIHHSCIHAM